MFAFMFSQGVWVCVGVSVGVSVGASVGEHGHCSYLGTSPNVVQVYQQPSKGRLTKECLPT